ncbi:MAG TPA: protein kinase [Polyangiaceae bacterium]|nr:protein kinase [Polyangiaceae bacterium]
MMPRQGTMIADRYRLERKVGGGRVSAMWRVRDQVTDGTCAIKLLHRSMNDHPEALARFSLEDRLSRELTGDYFAERVGSGSWHSLRYIAWRWYEGECLRSLFERNPKQDVHTVYSIVQETCQALAIVHGAGYTHGDLKPENLFFAERSEKESARQLKLIGFGVASRLARPLLGAQARRTPGQIVGTPLYLSPDLILGRVPRGGQADLWALSVIVYEALTGRAPFLGSDLAEVLQKILDRQAPRPSAITNNLPATFDLWWQQALEQQFATAAELSAGLARALAPALRSSRTQRSASLPDRTAPGMEIVVPWAAHAGGGQQPGESPLVPAASSRAVAGSPVAGSPVAGSTIAGSPAPNSPAAASSLAANPVSGGLAPSRPAAVSRGASASPASPSGQARNGSPAQPLPGSTGAAMGSAASGPPALQPSSPVGSITALGVGRPQVSTPLVATVVSKADARPSAVPRASVAQDPARKPVAAKLSDEAAKAGTGTLVAGKAESTNGVASSAGTPAAGEASSAAAKTAPSLSRGDDASGPGKSAPGTPAPAGAAGATAASATVAASAAEPARSPGGNVPSANVTGANVTSTTVAGIGPAALTMMRALEAAASGAPAKIRVTAPDGERAVGPDSEKFSAVPSQLLGLGSRKTLVGIVPPARLGASSVPGAPSASAPAPATASRKTESMVIAGSPCKSIEVSAEGDDELPPSIAALRRPGSPTVPFPRPRAASRAMPWEIDPSAGDPPGRDTIPQSWRDRTGHTLRIVLTNPNHRPHLIAGIVVCAAAALVIFAAGRSPVAGTGVLGQATRSLEPPAPPAAAESPQRTGSRELPPSAATPAPRVDAVAPDPAPPGLQGEELAPGLVIPARSTTSEAPARGEPKPGASPAGTPAGARPSSPLPPSSPPASSPHPVSSAPPAPSPHAVPAPAGHPAPPGDARSTQPASPGTDLHGVAPRAAPKKLAPEPGAPPRPAGGDFDFGI